MSKEEKKPKVKSKEELEDEALERMIAQEEYEKSNDTEELEDEKEVKKPNSLDTLSISRTKARNIARQKYIESKKKK